MSEQSRLVHEPIELKLSVRLRFVLDVDDLADRIGRDSMDVFAIAINLLKIAVDACDEGNRIAIVDEKLEEVIQEILIPGFGATETTTETTS